MPIQENKASEDHPIEPRAVAARRLARWPVQGAVLGTALLLSACAVGPDFKTPELPAAAQAPDYTPAPMPSRTVQAEGPAGQAQELVAGRDIPAQWWDVFRSEPLDQLIRASLAQSPTLASAQAALRQAEATYEAKTGNLWPQVSAQLGVQRERASEISTQVPGGQLLTLYNASVNVSYNLDVFGGTRRQIEGAQAAVDTQRYQVEAVYLTLTSNLVTTAIREASLRAQLQATREVLQAQTEQLNVIEKQFDTGAIPKSIVLQQRTQVAQTQATLPPIEKALAQTRHQLAVFAGRLPSEAGLPEFDLASLSLPQALPLSLPSELARQRPDVRASEAQLHQASAAVGVATANLYPQIQLSASYGNNALRARDLFTGPTTLWNIGAGLTQPIFNGGALRAQQRAAVAAYDSAAAQYRNTVLGAFQNVADALRALELDAIALQNQAAAESLARQSLDLSTAQFRAGAVSYVTLLTAQQAWLQTHTALVQAQAARYADTAALFQALGGGWWNRAELANATLSPTVPSAPAAATTTAAPVRN
ncbi:MULTISPECIES: efflux transporter outer membrane subunit [Variovorax]|jgi:NodT family efflux transporter outer membrane factor (OMF) lipoprotein|uniref:efflux transporter outer membrane subunit n=1 Tax=Variovorax TaxID=34072 RepID=UPI000AB0B756|nr:MULTISPECIES: efflux transporter outer membrane subunit [Variovorax]MBN8752071.1 efflux transporter outer membrane subunit [Variovorax sp.]UKI11587.1 efflux transporter outer membrane subunit [Variovorax paradoxus]